MPRTWLWEFLQGSEMMSGHSKWSSIKHKKAIVDARRGKLFTKLIRELTSAGKAGGGDTDTNPRLRTAIATAKAANMPADTIQRARCLPTWAANC